MEIKACTFIMFMKNNTEIISQKNSATKKVLMINLSPPPLDKI